MKGAVPGSLEPEHGSVVPRDLEDLPREEAEGQDGAVLVVLQVAVRRTSSKNKSRSKYS